ncbi:MAG: hypothetical protein GXY44_11270 [Phycisphaerales bacterium]|nr:hypothetical protein [Phycisphaerales bacterium]
MLNIRPAPVRTPLRSQWTWATSAVVAGVALILNYGLAEPVGAETVIRPLLVISVVLFVLSRILLLLPPAGMGPQLRRRWPDYVLLLSAFFWWQIDSERGPELLRLAAVYCIVTALLGIGRAGFDSMIDGLTRCTPAGAAWRFVLAVVVLVLLGGVMLTLPFSWQGAYPVEPGQPLARYNLAVHARDALFTATAAVTGTGLSVLDIGGQFSRAGQLVILILMQIGGLGVLIMAGALGWRLRRMIGWGPEVADDSRSLRRMVVFTCLAMVLFQTAAAVGLYGMWDSQIDPNFARALERPALFGGLFRDEARLFASVFHGISAFCNVGLVLPRDGMMMYRQAPAVYGCILPAMILGSLGGPVLYDLAARVLRRRRMGRDSTLTLAATGLLLVLGAGALFIVESTPAAQLRYPRADTPGRLMTQPTQPVEKPIIFSGADSELAARQRIRSLPPAERLGASLFQAAAARGGGMNTVRQDEASLSPASRWLMSGLMLVGGGIGGTGGGLRITLVCLLLTSWLRPRKENDSPNRAAGLAMATEIAAIFVGLIFLTTFGLLYREAGSVEACLFEAVSACCNAGLSVGLTPQLSTQGRIIIILAMFLGRVLPLCLLLRTFHAEPNPVLMRIDSSGTLQADR